MALPTHWPKDSGLRKRMDERRRERNWRMVMIVEYVNAPNVLIVK